MFVCPNLILMMTSPLILTAKAGVKSLHLDKNVKQALPVIFGRIALWENSRRNSSGTCVLVLCKVLFLQLCV